MGTGIKQWAVEYLVHTPCNQWLDKNENSNDFIVMEEVYENPNDQDEVTGFMCPKCGQVWDLVPRNKPS